MNGPIKRVLFATDFSATSDCAKAYATAIAGPLNAELHVLHVLDDPLPMPGPKGSWILPTAEEMIARNIDAANASLTEQLKNCEIRHGQIVRQVLIGSPTQTILDYANQHDIDVIVIGTHGRTGLAHVLIGSVAEKVVRLAKCPVLTVHLKDRERLEGRSGCVESSVSPRSDGLSVAAQ